MISVLILTYNEQVNLPRCLDAVSWSDDVLVLDSFSTDGTKEIALEKGARVEQRAFDHFAGQRNYGLDHGSLKHEWVLHLDADEIVTPPLRDELLSVSGSTSLNAFRLASKMMFQDRWLKFAGMYPAYQVRFGRRDRLRFKMVGHGQRETLSHDEVGTLKEPLLHFSFSKGLEDWYARHRRYAMAEAEENLSSLSDPRFSLAGLFASDATARRRALKELSIRLPFRPASRFAYMYFLRLGFLDGVPGLRYCRMLSAYERMIVTRLKDLQAQNQKTTSDS